MKSMYITLLDTYRLKQKLFDFRCVIQLYTIFRHAQAKFFFLSDSQFTRRFQERNSAYNWEQLPSIVIFNFIHDHIFFISSFMMALNDLIVPPLRLGLNLHSIPNTACGIQMTAYHRSTSKDQNKSYYTVSWKKLLHNPLSHHQRINGEGPHIPMGDILKVEGWGVLK